MIQIDKATGARTVIGPNGLATFPGTANFDIGPTGTFWAINTRGITYELYSINPTTGAPTLEGIITGITSGGNIAGLASQQVSVIPEPGSFTLYSLGIAGLADYRWRRRKRTV